MQVKSHVFVVFLFKKKTQRSFKVKNFILIVYFLLIWCDSRTQIIDGKSTGGITAFVCFRQSLDATERNMVDHFLCRVSCFRFDGSRLVITYNYKLINLLICNQHPWGNNGKKSSKGQFFFLVWKIYLLVPKWSGVLYSVSIY